MTVPFIDQCIFDVMIQKKKSLPIEKLNLTWNKQTSLNKLGSLSRVFQIVVRGRRHGKFAWGLFLLGGGNLTTSDFDHLHLFQS